jgi:MFS family permease
MWDRLQRRPLLTYFVYRSLALTWAFAPFQVIYLQWKGLTLAEVFDLNVVFSLSAVAFEVPTGVLADRYGRRVSMSAAGFVMALACGLFVVGHRFWTFAAANLLCALSMALASGADSAYLYDHLTATQQAQTYTRLEGWSTAAKGLGNLGAVLLGMVLYQYVHPASVFVLTAAFTLMAGVVAMALPEARVRHEGQVTDQLRRAFATLRDDGRLLAVVCFGAIAFVLLRLSLFADQPHLQAHLHGAWLERTALSLGVLAAAKEIGGAVVAGVSGALLSRVRGRYVASGLALVLVGAYALMGEDQAVPCILVMVLLASSFGLFSPLMRALMNRLIEGPRDRATLLSVEGMGRRLLFAAVSPVFGRAVEASTLHSTFTGTAWVASIAFAVLGVSAYLSFRLPAQSPVKRPSRPSAVASVA